MNSGNARNKCGCVCAGRPIGGRGGARERVAVSEGDLSKEVDVEIQEMEKYPTDGAGELVCDRSFTESTVGYGRHSTWSSTPATSNARDKRGLVARDIPVK